MNFKDIKNKEFFIGFKKQCISDLDTYINRLMQSNYKQAVNLTYWIRDYKNYVQQEQTFKPKYLPVYSYGAVVEINLGFRLGSEFGGLHYGIVLNKKDKKSNPNLTIIPMRSMKEKIHYTELSIGDEFFNLAESKVNLLNDELNRMQSDFKKEILHVNHLITDLTSKDVLSDDGINLEDLYSKIEDLEQENKRISKTISEHENCLKRISKLKNGSIVLPNQVLTISKMRIRDPIRPGDTLHNIKLSKATMARIKEKFHQLYFD